MIFARKGFAETLLDLKMSLGLDIAVGLVSFKLRERVSTYIVVFHVSQYFNHDGNTKYPNSIFETHLAKEMVNQAPIPLQAPARGKRKKKRQ
jgi:hypothetical protein